MKENQHTSPSSPFQAPTDGPFCVGFTEVPSQRPTVRSLQRPSKQMRESLGLSPPERMQKGRLERDDLRPSKNGGRFTMGEVGQKRLQVPFPLGPLITSSLKGLKKGHRGYGVLTHSHIRITGFIALEEAATCKHLSWLESKPMTLAYLCDASRSSKPLCPKRGGWSCGGSWGLQGFSRLFTAVASGLVVFFCTPVIESQLHSSCLVCFGGSMLVLSSSLSSIVGRFQMDYSWCRMVLCPFVRVGAVGYLTAVCSVSVMVC